MRHVLSLLLVLGCLLPPAPCGALEQTRRTFTEREKERITRLCMDYTDPRERNRCEVHQLTRAEQEWGKSHPIDAYALYDRLDLGGYHLRNRVQTERLNAFREYWSAQRRTYSQFEPSKDINTTRLPYVNTVREERLDCMYVAHGRPRTLCLEWQKDRAQKMMQNSSIPER
jgi:hypothetical protein